MPRAGKVASVAPGLGGSRFVRAPLSVPVKATAMARPVQARKVMGRVTAAALLAAAQMEMGTRGVAARVRVVGIMGMGATG